MIDDKINRENALEKFYAARNWCPAIYPKDHPEVRLRKNPGSHEQRQANVGTFEEVTQKWPGHYVGWLSNEGEPYAIVDLDPPKDRKAELKEAPKAVKLQYLREEFIPSLPEKFQQLVATNYTEVSASGLGLRCIMLFRGDKTKYSRYIKTKEFEGQVNLSGDMFMICTQDRFTDGKVLGLSEDFLRTHFKVKGDHSDGDEDGTDETKAFTIEERQQLLGQNLYDRVMRLPIDQSDKIKAVWQDLTGAEYQHYEYWMHVAMALHDVGTLTYTEDEAFVAFHKWSQLDEEGYVSEEDCRRTWDACPQRGGGITHKTLIELLNRLEFAWPHPVINRAGKVTSKPKVGSYENFEYLLNYFGIKLYRDSSYRFYMTGTDQHTLDKHFNLVDQNMIVNGKALGRFYGPFSDEELYSRMFAFAQMHGYDDKIGRAKVKEFTDAYIHLVGCERFNLMYHWLATPYSELPEALKHEGIQGGARDVSIYNDHSNLDYITACITPSVRMPGKERGCEIAIRLFFMGMAKLLSNVHTPMRFDENAGMLLLIGPEGVYKTSFFKSLLPHALNEQCVLTVQGLTKNVASKAMRDVYRYMANSGIVIFDEFDSLPKEFLQSEMKKLISGNTIEFTEIYQKTAVKLPRAAAIGGTTNSDKIIMSDYGNRRLWPLMVQHIDTSALIKVNWHKFYRDLISEFEDRVAKGETPWLPTQEELDILKNVQDKVSSSTGFEQILEEIFPARIPFPGLGMFTSIQAESKYLYKMKDIKAILAQAGEHLNRRDLPALRQALARYAGKYTGTHGKEVTMPNANAVVKNGKAEQGQHTRWILPPQAGAPFGDME
jgi:hypothetical protein